MVLEMTTRRAAGRNHVYTTYLVFRQDGKWLASFCDPKDARAYVEKINGEK
jgi:hypothetical protein